MITLSNHVTTIKYFDDANVVSSVITDTLYVQNVNLDFSTGAMYATIARGIVVNGVFASNYPSVNIVVNPDGSFISNDGKWSGNLGATASNLVTQLKTTFDQFVLGAGLVQGTIK